MSLPYGRELSKQKLSNIAQEQNNILSLPYHFFSIRSHPYLKIAFHFELVEKKILDYIVVKWMRMQKNGPLSVIIDKYMMSFKYVSIHIYIEAMFSGVWKFWPVQGFRRFFFQFPHGIVKYKLVQCSNFET